MSSLNIQKSHEIKIYFKHLVRAVYKKLAKRILKDRILSKHINKQEKTATKNFKIACVATSRIRINKNGIKK